MPTVSGAAGCLASLVLGAWVGSRSSGAGPAVPNITVLVRCGSGSGESGGTGASVYLNNGLVSELEETGSWSWARPVIDTVWWIVFLIVVGYGTCWRRGTAAAGRPQPVGALPRLTGVPPTIGGRDVLGW